MIQIPQKSQVDTDWCAKFMMVFSEILILCVSLVVLTFAILAMTGMLDSLPQLRLWTLILLAVVAFWTSGDTIFMFVEECDNGNTCTKQFLKISMIVHIVFLVAYLTFVVIELFVDHGEYYATYTVDMIYVAGTFIWTLMMFLRLYNKDNPTPSQLPYIPLSMIPQQPPKEVQPQPQMVKIPIRYF